MKKIYLVQLFALVTALTACGQNNKTPSTVPMTDKVIKTEEQWLKELGPDAYYVLRQKGTERPFSGKYYEHSEAGTYTCAACGNELFYSETKFDAHCGWPSFYKAIDKNKIIERPDRSHGMIRTEVLCAKCDGHLGHVFDDGPEPTGMRYCINSVSIGFIPGKKKDQQGPDQDK